MLEKLVSSGSGPIPTCSDLEHQGVRDNIQNAGGNEEEAEAIDQLAEIFVDAMMRLEQEHGLTPRQMQEYYAGRLEVVKRDGGVQ